MLDRNMEKTKANGVHCYCFQREMTTPLPLSLKNCPKCIPFSHKNFAKSIHDPLFQKNSKNSFPHDNLSSHDFLSIVVPCPIIFVGKDTLLHYFLPQKDTLFSGTPPQFKYESTAIPCILLMSLASVPPFDTAQEL